MGYAAHSESWNIYMENSWTCFIKKIDKDSLLAKWINAVAFAMTTGLMIRIIIFPTGALAETQLLDRLIPFLIGVLTFLFFSQKPIVGLLVGVLAFSSTVIYNQYF